MTDKPDPALFSVATFPGEYDVCVKFECETNIRIKANSRAEAIALAEEKLQSDSFTLDQNDIEDADIIGAAQRCNMYRITRDGQKMQASHLQAGDQPRELDERGF